ncbi:MULTISPECIES: hypothetical protein [unclassified Microbacterium]|uniref:hypothetical protein n=1 Tax=unclassified Microbacterium TaxID=2609290 RepID=UPI00214AEC7E|nr:MULTISPECIES: hypothetical protein [unclassified Microbacterium]MCR2785370.1 hypothetical protein [Microbacterium sp. zg.B96]WIM16895.1 hypothetical protein QNO11_04430 [Microbacterium sp. zg-B96]
MAGRERTGTDVRGHATTTASVAAASGRVLDRDLLSAGVYISVELSPLNVPDRATVVGAVRELIGMGASARAGRTFDGARWRYDPDTLDEQAERMVRALPVQYIGDEGLPRLREAVDPDLPFTVFLGEDRASLCIDHRLGDGFLGVMLTAGTLTGRPAPSVFGSTRDTDPLRAALATTFLRHPRRAVDVVRDRLGERNTTHAGGPTVSAERGSLDLVTGRMDPDTYRSVAAWSRGRVPPTLAMMFALSAALRQVGVPVMDEGSILVDLRRYLPSGRSTLANFVVGHPIAAGDGLDAAGARFSRDLHVGRPLAALTTGLLTRGWRRPAPAEVPAAAKAIVSDMGFLRALEPLPWSGEGVVRVSVDPAGRNGITALTAVLKRRLNISVSFDGSLYDRDTIAAACELLCRDPEGLLP